MPNYAKMTANQLLDEYRKASAFTASGLKAMAEIWMALVNKGFDVTPYMSPLSRIFPDIASGKLLPEAALLFGLMPSAVVEGAKSLVPEVQAQLAKSEGRVEILQADGKVRNTRLQDLGAREITQLIGNGRIRTIAEQKRHIVPPPKRPAAPMPRQEMPDDEPINAGFDLYFVMTSEQITRLTTLADEMGVTPAQFAVDYLVRHKVLPGKPVKRPVYRGKDDRPGARAP